MAQHQIVYYVGEQAILTQFLESGEEITPPVLPETEGEHYKGWGNYPKVMPEKDLEVHAIKEGDTYILTQMVNDEIWATYEVQAGEPLNHIQDPQKEGYTFSGWVKSYKVMPQSNLTLHGTMKVNRHKLTFEVDGISFERTVEYGTPLTNILVPERDHQTFSGWGDIPATMPDRDLLFKGTFSLDTYSITYLIEGVEYQKVTLSFGDVVKPVSVPQKEGYVFSGWRGLPKSMPNENIVVDGSYYIKKFRVRFFVDGEKYTWSSICPGEVITLPEEPIKEGYRFIRWDNLPEVMPEKDIVVEALFEKA